MPVLETATLSAATFLGGTGTSAFFSWLRAKRRAPIDTMRAEVAAAKDINEMATATLDRVTTELDAVTSRLDKVEAQQEKTLRELHRVDSLFREALGVLREVIIAAREGRLPPLVMSDELRAEVEHGGVL